MNKLMGLAVTLCCASLMTGVVRVSAEETTPAAAEKKAAMTQVVYVCPHCHTLSLKSGNCGTCGKETKVMHVLGVKGGEAMLCGCGAACTCSPAKMKDGKCGCGEDVKKASVKGLYVCADGCPEIADKPGKCACGKKMKMAE